MKVLRLAAIALFSLAPLAVCAQSAPSAGKDVAARAEVGAAVTAVGADSFAGISIPFAGGVRGYPDVVYETLLGYRPMKLDLFLPPPSFAAKGPRPVIVYIHGGGWVGGGPRRSAAYSDWPKVLASMAEHGYVVASVSYRFAGEAPFPAAIQDVKAAIRFLRANSAKYGIDSGRFVTIGQSAGGHLASLAAVSCGAPGLSPPATTIPKAANVELTASAAKGADEVSDCVQGAVSWFGVYDFSTMPKGKLAGKSPMDMFLHCPDTGCDADVVKAASPLSYVTAKTPPILVMHGAKDRQVPVDQAYRFEAALKAAGVKTDLVIYPDTDHSWINPTPEETGAVSRGALSKSLDFIEALIGDKK